MKTRHLLAVAPALLLVGGALSAQDAAPLRFGLSASLAQPLTADFKVASLGDAFEDCLSTGVSLGASAELGLASNIAIRFRAEYLSFGGKDSLYSQTAIEYVPYYGDVVVTYTGKLNYDLSVVALGADFMYSLNSNNDGGYAFAGLGHYITSGSGSVATELSALGIVVPAGSMTLEGSGNALGVSLGAGFRFNQNFAAELRFTTMDGLKHKVDGQAYLPDEPARPLKDYADIDLSWIQVGLCWRF
jgi:hypothetical protein